MPKSIEEYTKWADKIDDAKERNAIGDLSMIAYRMLTEIIKLRYKGEK